MAANGSRLGEVGDFENETLKLLLMLNRITMDEITTSSPAIAKPLVGGSTVKSENRKIGLGFGCLSEPIGKQLKAQGFKFDAKKVSYFEREVEAINTLRFGSGLITDSMVDKMIPKLYKKIVQHVAKENKLSILS